MLGGMTGTAFKDGSDVWGFLETYAQLFRAMMPRAANIAVFNAAGHMRWSHDATIGPDLTSRVEAMLPVARDQTAGEGTLELLGEQPAHCLFWIRSDEGTLLAVVAVLTPAGEQRERTARVLLRPFAAASGDRVPAARTARPAHHR